MQHHLAAPGGVCSQMGGPSVALLWHSALCRHSGYLLIVGRHDDMLRSLGKGESHTDRVLD